MSDLVERLRSRNNHHHCLKAADHIEDLEAQVAALQARVKELDSPIIQRQGEIIREREEDIKALQARVEELDKIIHELRLDRIKRKKENKRLNAVLDRLALLGCTDKDCIGGLRELETASLKMCSLHCNL